MGKPKKNEKEYLCLKCGAGIVKTVLKDLDEEVSFEVHKCSNCKYQYGIKEFWKDYANINPTKNGND